MKYGQNVRLLDIEYDIRKRVAKDKTDPEIYIDLYDLAYYFMRRRKKLNNIEEYEEISHNIATSLYLKLQDGFEIKSYLGYISRTLIWYINDYRNSSYYRVIDTTDDPDLKDAIISMSAAAAKSFDSQYKFMLNNVYFDSLLTMIDTSVNKRCRYYKDDPCVINLKISVVLSIIYGYALSYELDSESEDYLPILINLVADDIAEDLMKNCAELEQDYESLLTNVLWDAVNSQPTY